MKNQTSVRTIIFCLSVILLVILASPAVYAWDPAAHAYIEEHLHKKQGLSDANSLSHRIYGSYMIDMFNYDFSVPQVYFAAYLHDPAQSNFLTAWETADNPTEKAFAYGFVSHNNSWGMDSTAHFAGMTTGRTQGYVIAKSNELAGMLGPAFAQIGLVLPDEVLVDISHFLVESGVDLLVRSLDPSIGNKIMMAAYSRSNEVPALLVDAYAADLAALAGDPDPGNVAQMILASEGSSRAYLMAYGWALTQDNALDLIAGGLAQQAGGYFALKGYPPIPEAVLKQAAQQGIIAAMSLCAVDFAEELRATTGWVNGRLSSEGIVW